MQWVDAGFKITTLKGIFETNEGDLNMDCVLNIRDY